ncbi:hypothetical protein GALMADRAFT_109268 [Galerina marginata CBS 339.88]|uniref:Peptidase C14 caspase domain-containing protein n=1 Tax=Galerina marginata (strain CBS 339.88) TaxID=685588 RepID=A0A067TTZ2_GALM3|nr:hypothetical protein GALMADRAFT_109268 [Galerina marginata CBS 339.88]
MPQKPLSWTSPTPNLFALIIGIDVYESDDFPRLRGAVRDALAYKSYLTDHLVVREDQIKMLINKQASRLSILLALKSIKEDSRIKEGDPIFIFYAGHGSEVEAPSNWDSGSPKCKIQMLVPQDYSPVEGSEVPGIPDRTIGALLEDIAEVKGNNITVVFDCCHSYSATRGSDSGRARSVLLNPTIHREDLDREIWGKGIKGSHPVFRFRFSGLRSHILIAACHSSELARESTSSGSGMFSLAFLKLLMSVPPYKLRYFEILTRMDQLSGQNPQVEGFDQSRYLFGAAVHVPSSLGYPIRYDAMQRSFLIDGGSAHGVTSGSQFAILQAQDSEVRTPIGTLVVKKVTAFSSTVEFNPLLSTLLVSRFPTTTAVQTRPGKRDRLRLYIRPGPKYSASHEFLQLLLQRHKDDLHGVVLVDKIELAHLELSIERGTASPLLVDKRATRHGFHSQLPILNAGDAEMATFLGSASRYFWELDRKSDNGGLVEKLEVAFYELQEGPSPFDDVKRPEMSPVGRNLFNDNKVVIDQEQRFYGVKLTNKGSRDLYPSLLYFANTDLADITTYFSTASCGPYLPESPLKEGGGTLTIGYGSGGMAPLSYSLPDGQDVAVGFLKIFLFTRPLGPSSGFPNQMEKWDTFVIPIIQRRYRFLRCLIQ